MKNYEKERRQFEWSLRDAGIELPCIQRDNLWCLVYDLVEREYERGYDEGSRKIDDPRDEA